MTSLHGGITNAEAENCQEAFLCSLYTRTIYNQWRHMKASLKFKTERNFVEYLMEYIIRSRSDVMEYLKYGCDKEAYREWFLNHLSRKDDSNIGLHCYSEAALSCDAMLLMMYGFDLYIKSRKIKSFLHFNDEATFIQWVMLFVTSSKYQLNLATCTVNDRSAAPQTKEQEKRGLPKQEVSSIVRDYLCKHCGFVSSDRKTVLNHMSQHSGEESRNVDNKLMRKLQYLPLARTKTSVQNKSDCKVCLRVFRSGSSLMKHVLNVHLNENKAQHENTITHPGTHFFSTNYNIHGCYSNNYTAKSKYYLKQHNCSPKTCQHCAASFKKAYLLKEHIRKVHGLYHQHTCQYCNLQFPSKMIYLEHRILNHPLPSDKSYACNVCGKSFPLKRLLTSHSIEQHNGYVCDTCGKTFKLCKQWKVHILSHSNERTLLCSQCPATFKLMQCLRRHQKVVHNKEKSYVCDQCSATFATHGNLFQHQVYVHGMLSPYQCNICKKYFPCASHLGNHAKKHI